MEHNWSDFNKRSKEELRDSKLKRVTLCEGEGYKSFIEVLSINLETKGIIFQLNKKEYCNYYLISTSDICVVIKGSKASKTFTATGWVSQYESLTDNGIYSSSHPSTTNLIPLKNAMLNKFLKLIK